ncbi:3-oxoacyl-ACP synthase [Aquimarina sp. MMG016]|uniref:3-oxoacyl-ACP synthase n=1 Tax=Aquimarina sp. MMG016 TaxID=2822690 RepID=UPI001B3A5966|nr:3-oxoacyl-ACP synthase [Aquimarina sp. MMG016]
MNPDQIKQELFIKSQNYVDQRLQRIHSTISGIQESLTSETKSTAGDKHETGRAMLQLEREKAGVQLAEVQKLQGILSKIDISSSSKLVRLGSLVYTSQANYFISISIGEVKVNNELYYAIAANSPIGKMLLGKKNGNSFSFNGKSFVINKIS